MNLRCLDEELGGFQRPGLDLGVVKKHGEWLTPQEPEEPL
jgi:hypothetical protein